jgi:hypothetical protein
MLVEGSSHLGPDEAIKREQAERLLADIYDVVVLLVAAYANKILPPLLPHFPYMLPPGDVAHNISKLGIVHDAIMAWASEALERAGVPHRPVSEEERALHFKRLEELDRQHAEVRAELGSAERMVGEAVWRLAALNSDSPARVWNQVWSELGQAISQLLDASTRLMKLDAVRAAATQPVEDLRQPNRDIFVSRLNEAIRARETEDPYDPKIGRVGAATRDVLYGLGATDDDAAVIPVPQAGESVVVVDTVEEAASPVPDPTLAQRRAAQIRPF